MNRRSRRWLAKQPKAYRDSVEETHRIVVDLHRRYQIEKAIDGVNAKIATDQDATEALLHFYDATENIIC